MRSNTYESLLDLELHSKTPEVEPLYTGDGDIAVRDIVFRPPWSDRPIYGCPWDYCYLIDNKTEQNPGKFWSREDVLQMIARFLHVTGGATEFAHVFRAQKVQAALTCDRFIIDQVVAPTGQDEQDPALVPIKAVYRARFACGYSSFGLAEITIDQDGIQKQAAIRLAKRVVQSLVRGDRSQTSLSDWDLDRLVQEDLGTIPQDQTRSEQFSLCLNYLWRALLIGSEVNWLKRLDAEFAEMMKREPPAASEELLEIERRWRSLPDDLTSSESHLLMQATIDRRYSDFVETQRKPGLCFVAVREVVIRWFQQYGCQVTAQLVERIPSFVKKLIEQSEQESTRKRPKCWEVVAPLVDAEFVPRLPFGTSRKKAISHWYSKTCQAVQSHILDQWSQTLMRRRVIPLLQSLKQQIENSLGGGFLSESDQSPEWLLKRLNGLAESLEVYEHRLRHVRSRPQRLIIQYDWSDSLWDDLISKTLRQRMELLPSRVKEAQWNDIARMVVSKPGSDGQSMAIPIWEMVKEWLRSTEDNFDPIVQVRV